VALEDPSAHGLLPEPVNAVDGCASNYDWYRHAIQQTPEADSSDLRSSVCDSVFQREHIAFAVVEVIPSELLQANPTKFVTARRA